MSRSPGDTMDDSGGAVPKKKAKPEGGCRCVVGGCSNTNYDGFSIHELPKQKGSVRNGWINFIKLKRARFNANERVRVHVCSGHFDRTQYDETQVMMYQMNIRKLPPRLKPTAIPHIHKAIQPFSPDFFVQESATTTTTSSTVVTTTATTTATTFSISTMSNMPSSASCSYSTLDPVPTATISKLARPVLSISGTKEETSADASTSTTLTDANNRPGKNPLKRRLSVYCRKKDVQRITEEYEQKQIEEEAQERLRKEKENTKATQFSPQMMNKMSQKRTRTKTCGISVKPLGKAKRIQTLQSPSLEKPQIKQHDAATQTVLQAKNVGQEEGNDEEEAEVLEDDTQKDPDYKPDVEELHEELEERKMNEPADILH
nr:protein phosphatase 1 regulatory subunit 12B-like [Lytechinus pictus]